MFPLRTGVIFAAMLILSAVSGFTHVMTYSEVFLFTIVLAALNIGSLLITSCKNQVKGIEATTKLLSALNAKK